MNEQRPEEPANDRSTPPATDPTTAPSSANGGANPAGRSRLWWVVLAVAVVAVAGLLVFLVNRDADPRSDTATDGAGASESEASEPVATLLADGISFGTEGPLVEVYLDFFCEQCSDLESRVGQTMAEMAGAGEMTLVLRPVKFVSPFSGRVAAALSCTVGSGESLAYQEAVFAEGGILPRERLVAIAAEVGIEDPAFAECVSARETRDFVDATTDAARDRGVAGVPALFLAGEQVDPAITETPEDFRAAIDELSG